jgi:hypothetical protein
VCRDFAAVPQIGVSGFEIVLIARDPDAVRTLGNVALVGLEPPGESRLRIFEAQWPVDVVNFEIQDAHARSASV